MQTQVQEAEKPSQLKRDLGLWSLDGLGVGGIIGSGIFGLDFVLGRSR